MMVISAYGRCNDQCIRKKCLYVKDIINTNEKTANLHFDLLAHVSYIMVVKGNLIFFCTTIHVM